MTYEQPKRKLMMWGAYDNVEKDLIPRTFHRRMSDAKNEVFYWKKEKFHWAKKAGVRRVEVVLPDEVTIEIRTHEYKHIHK